MGWWLLRRLLDQKAKVFGLILSVQTLFSRLFHLEEAEAAAVGDRANWSNQQTTVSWNWRREPSGRVAADLADLSNLLSVFIKSNRSFDTWSWKLSSDGIYYPKILSRLIDDHDLRTSSRPFQETLRNNFVPLKVEVLVWRLLKRRLPVRVELDKRGIDLHSVCCLLCDDNLESLDHTFIFCKFVMDVWERVYKWWGLGSVTNLSINETFKGNSDSQLCGISAKLWQAVEWCH
ncbi:uncharacterized protein [Rutidosis leptorrhynchoides]|uniref:uncharacterized protein n=1 Tax=Rutidosis leptorrhynchoides TaxID=125765 RepID=UPI003A9A5169